MRGQWRSVDQSVNQLAERAGLYLFKVHIFLKKIPVFSTKILLIVCSAQCEYYYKFKSCKLYTYLLIGTY